MKAPASVVSDQLMLFIDTLEQHKQTDDLFGKLL